MADTIPAPVIEPPEAISCHAEPSKRISVEVSCT